MFHKGSGDADDADDADATSIDTTCSLRVFQKAHYGAPESAMNYRKADSFRNELGQSYPIDCP